jgi:hypothetical protein
MFKIIKNQKGQGLLEMMVAIGVISVGLFSVWALFLSNYNGEQEAGARVLAVNLAREGVEVVKNIRDTNWLHIENNEACGSSDPCLWDSGLVDLVGAGTGTIKNISLSDVYIDFNVENINNELTKLYTDKITGLYGHDNAGNSTRYRRMIKIQNICCIDSAPQDLKCDDFNFQFQSAVCPNLKVGLSVASTVNWTIEGRTRELTVYNRLFNWK